MDLTILIAVNIIAMLILYLVFSIKIKLTLDKHKQKQGKEMIRELKENITLTIQYMNNSIDLIEKKNKTFYHLMLRSEELSRKLERLIEEEKSLSESKKRRKSPKKSQDSIKEPQNKKSESKDELKDQEPPEYVKTPSDTEKNRDEAGVYRAYQKMYGGQTDTFELPDIAQGSETIYQSGRSTTEILPEENSWEKSGAGRLLSFMGKMVRQAAGVDKRIPIDSSFAKNKTIVTQNKKLAESGNVVSNDDATGWNRGGEIRPVAENMMEQKSVPTQDHSPQVVFPSEKKSPVAGMQEIREQSLAMREAVAEHFRYMAEHSGGVRNIQERDKKLIRTMLDSGYTPTEIAAMTRTDISLIELMEGVGTIPDRPRKNRLVSL